MSAGLNRLVTKKDFLRTRYLLGLPYLQLLHQLIRETNKNTIKNVHQLNTLLLLSSRHQCKDLFDLRKKLIQQSHSHNSIQNTSGYIQKWTSITQSALSHKFNPFSVKSQTSHQQLIKYLQQVYGILTKLPSNSSSNTESTINSKSKPSFGQSISQLSLQLCTYGLAQHYNTWHLPRKSKQQLQQQYVITVDALFANLSASSSNNDDDSNNSLIQMPVSSLFPIQIFNITDQPMIKDCYLKYLEKRLAFDHKTIAWLARIGLPCTAYLYKWIQNHKKILLLNMLNNSKIYYQNELQNCNSIFLITRKLLCFPARQIPASAQIELIKMTKEIFFNNYIIKQFESQNQKMGPDNALQSLHLKLLIDVLYSENQITLCKNQLFNKFSLTFSSKLTQKQFKNTIQQIFECKLIRTILLYIHFTISDLKQDNKSASLLNINKLINCNTFCNWVQNCAHIHDILAQVIYMRDCVRASFHRNNIDFNSNKLNTILQKRVKYFKKAIKQIQNNQQITKQSKQSEKGHVIMPQSIQSIQQLLSGSSRLMYNSRTFLSSQKQSVIRNKQIVSSILNDTCYLSSYSSAAVRQKLKSQISSNIKLDTISVNRAQSYPYFPDLKLNGFSKQPHNIYIRSSINKQTRVQQQNKSVIDISDVINIERFLKSINVK